MKALHFFLLCVSVLVTRSTMAQDRNVVFIAVDDLKPLIGAYGDGTAITPNIDRLTGMGVTFTNNHCQQAVCAPSRTSLLTGVRPDLTEVRDLKTLMRDKNPGILTLPQHFKNNGYTTIGMGKIFDARSVDTGMDKVSWSQPYITPRKLGVSLPAYRSEEHRKGVNQARASGKAKGLTGNPLRQYVKKTYRPSTESFATDDESYFDGWMTTQAVKQLASLAKSTSPFFLALGFHKPHLPFVAPKKYWDLYDRSTLPLAAYQQKAAHTTGLSYHNSGELRQYTDIPAAFGKDGLLKEEKQRELIHGYYASVSYVDALVGKILHAIEKNGLLDNTTIVLWGDHGWHLGDHGLWNKHTNFEQATRSPLIIANPKGNKGVKNNSPTEFVDVFPTLCDLAGLRAPGYLQGKSLVPVLEGKKEAVKEYAVSQFRRGGSTGYALRNDRYRFVAWYKGGKTGPRASITARELYDYQKDPLETENRVDKAPGVASDLQKQLEEFLERLTIEKTGFKQIQRKTKPGIATNTKPTRQIIRDKYGENNLYIGAAIGYKQLNTKVEKALVTEFNYTVPQNAAKQTRVYPYPGAEWNWKPIDDIVKMARKNKLAVRLHGPISPQSSQWAKEDHRTPGELREMMETYFTALCQRFNGNPAVKWMDVVNETVNKDGTWFGPKPGTDSWENPWTQIGFDTDENKTPLYISRAFEIANQHAPDISLVLNQHSGMQPVMWEKLKSTVMYLRKKGLRVDGIGWQAHMEERDGLAFDEERLHYLAELIDWAHENDLDFHVTELDFRIRGKPFDEEMEQKHADAYANILKVLLSKREKGGVTYNIWGLEDGTGRYADSYRFLYKKDMKEKKALSKLKGVLENPGEPLVLHEGDHVLVENFDSGHSLAGWILFGESKITRDRSNGVGNSGCAAFESDKMGMKYKLNGLAPNTTYEVALWARSTSKMNLNLEVKQKGREDEIHRFRAAKGAYQKETLTFTTQANTRAELVVNRWTTDADGTAFVDDIKVYPVSK